MHVEQATSSYEAWLGARVPLIEEDLETKHRLMKQSALAFVRGTFYRWAQRFPEVCGRLMHAPVVLGVGDLHISNFGTWRDSAGNLIWGINDFDEACQLPYASDLVRLAVSANFAAKESDVKISVEMVCRAICDGYVSGMMTKGRPLLVDEVDALAKLPRTSRAQERAFWAKLDRLPDVPAPTEVARALLLEFPGKNLHIVHRVGGLGSLGRRRYTAHAENEDGRLAREAKEIAPSAWVWAHGGRSVSVVGRLYRTAVRASDPALQISRRWMIRSLGPDATRIDLDNVPGPKTFAQLLTAMGRETANVHLGSGVQGLILADLTLRRQTWLEDAVRTMSDSVESDWKEWRRSLRRAVGAG